MSIVWPLVFLVCWNSQTFQRILCRICIVNEFSGAYAALYKLVTVPKRLELGYLLPIITKISESCFKAYPDTVLLTDRKRKGQASTFCSTGDFPEALTTRALASHIIWTCNAVNQT